MKAKLINSVKTGDKVYKKDRFYLVTNVRLSNMEQAEGAMVIFHDDDAIVIASDNLDIGYTLTPELYDFEEIVVDSFIDLRIKN